VVIVVLAHLGVIISGWKTRICLDDASMLSRAEVAKYQLHSGIEVSMRMMGGGKSVPIEVVSILPKTTRHAMLSNDN
jgi:hypothetical protein